MNFLKNIFGRPKQSDISKYTSDIDRNSLTCIICFNHPYEPIVTHCGHLYCWACLYQWIETQKECRVVATCPMCNGELSMKTMIPIYHCNDMPDGADRHGLPRRPNFNKPIETTLNEDLSELFLIMNRIFEKTLFVPHNHNFVLGGFMVILVLQILFQKCSLLSLLSTITLFFYWKDNNRFLTCFGAAYENHMRLFVFASGIALILILIT